MEESNWIHVKHPIEDNRKMSILKIRAAGLEKDVYIYVSHTEVENPENPEDTRKVNSWGDIENRLTDLATEKCTMFMSAFNMIKQMGNNADLKTIEEMFNKAGITPYSLTLANTYVVSELKKGLDEVGFNIQDFVSQWHVSDQLAIYDVIKAMGNQPKLVVASIDLEMVELDGEPQILTKYMPGLLAELRKG